MRRPFSPMRPPHSARIHAKIASATRGQLYHSGEPSRASIAEGPRVASVRSTVFLADCVCVCLFNRSDQLSGRPSECAYILRSSDMLERQTCLQCGVACQPFRLVAPNYGELSHGTWHKRFSGEPVPLLIDSFHIEVQRTKNSFRASFALGTF
jgi:hypothetical protein